MAFFDSAVIPSVLGFKKRGKAIFDKLTDVGLEYDPLSVIGKKLFESGQFEEDEIRFFAKLLGNREAPVVLDIGANIGLHSIRWAAACPTLRSYAFEPSRETLTMLRNNVVQSGHAPRIEVIPMAVADRQGAGNFFHCVDDAYSSLRDTHRKQVETSYQVDITTIDSFVSGRRLSKIDLVKIDVEGLELEVLNGAIETLRRLRPHLFVEIFAGTHSNPDPEGTINRVRLLGYEPYIFQNGAPKPFVRHSDEFYNYYFCPKA